MVEENSSKSTMKTGYVVGFLIKEGTQIALIRKNRPEWQLGRLNGIGGHIEQGEEPLEAMIREFREETGCSISDWLPFCTLIGRNSKIHFFKAYGDYPIQTTTDEEVQWVEIDKMKQLNVIPNLHWMVPLALTSSTYKEVYE